MPLTLRFDLPTQGVRFRVAPQPGFAPVTIHVAPTHGPITAGPRDERIHTILAKSKAGYKSDEDQLYRKRPPFKGQQLDPVESSPAGHFDQVPEDTHAFSATAAFATVASTLAVWEHHYEAGIPWFFLATLGPSLELIPQVRSNNAWMGEGFLEFGFPDHPDDHDEPWAVNFDAVSHETGHLILRGGRTPNYDAASVRASAELLAPNVGQYIFISSISAYADPLAPHSDERAPLAPMDRDDTVRADDRQRRHPRREHADELQLAQDEHRARRRFFEGLEKGVGRRRVEPVGSDEHRQLVR